MATVDLHPDFREFLKSLNSAKIKYLLLGGYAVIYYGYRRVTDDLRINKRASGRSKDAADLQNLPSRSARQPHKKKPKRL